MAGKTRSGGRQSQPSRNSRAERRRSAGRSPQTDRLERLLAAGLEIFGEHALEGVLQRVSDAARELVGARYAALGVLNEDRTALAQFVTSGLSAPQRARIGALPSGNGLLGLVIRDPRPIRTADIQKHPARYGFPPHHPAMRSFLGVPIMTHDRVFGNLYLTEKIGEKEFDAEDEQIALLLARKAGVAIENARLLEQLQESRASRDQFYSMMNHELRNALTGVVGWLDLLMRGAGGSPPVAAVQASDAAEQSVQLLNDLLDLSRLDAGRLEIKAEQTGAETILAEALRTVTPMAQGAGVHLKVSRIDSPIPTSTDGKRVRQVLVNVLRNAIQHSPPQGAVTVVLEPTEESVSYTIVDQGPGITADDQERVFQAYMGSTQEVAGTGLGLTLSRLLARKLGGDIAVQSEHGRGAIFTVRLPRVPPNRPRPSA